MEHTLETKKSGSHDPSEKAGRNRGFSAGNGHCIVIALAGGVGQMPQGFAAGALVLGRQAVEFARGIDGLYLAAVLVMPEGPAIAAGRALEVFAEAVDRTCLAVAFE